MFPSPTDTRASLIVRLGDPEDNQYRHISSYRSFRGLKGKVAEGQWNP